MSFNPNDEVICIMNDSKGILELEKKYTISDYFIDDDLHIIKLKEIPILYYCINFISIDNYRELKIRKIKYKTSK